MNDFCNLEINKMHEKIENNCAYGTKRSAIHDSWKLAIFLVLDHLNFSLQTIVYSITWIAKCKY